MSLVVAEFIAKVPNAPNMDAAAKTEKAAIIISSMTVKPLDLEGVFIPIIIFPLI